MTHSPRSGGLAPDTPVGELLVADLPTQLAALEALCEAITSGDIQDERDQHTGPELGSASVRVHQACARLTAKRYQWIAAEEADGLWATSESHPRTYASYVAHTHESPIPTRETQFAWPASCETRSPSSPQRSVPARSGRTTCRHSPPPP